MAHHDGLEVAHSSLPERFAQALEKEHYTYVQTPDVSREEMYSEQKQKQSRKGVSLWVLVGAVITTAVVMGAALGGGLGSQLSRKGTCSANTAEQQTTTRTVTITATGTSSTPATTSGGQFVSYSVANPQDVYSVPLGCKDGQTYTTHGFAYFQSVQSFAMSCGIDMAGGNLVSLTAYSFEDCMEACAAMNHYNGKNLCLSTVFHSLFRYQEIMPDGLNCWLNNGSAAESVPFNRGEYLSLDTAIARLITN